MSVWDYVFMVINFVILFGAVYFFAHKKVKKSFKDRSEKIASDLKAADEARLQAAAISKELTEEEIENNEARQKILDEGEALAKINSTASIENANNAAHHIQATEIASERQLCEDMFTLLGDEAFDGIAKNAENVFRQGLLTDSVSGLVDECMENINVSAADSDLRQLGRLKKVEAVICSAAPLENECVGRIKNRIIDGLIEYDTEVDDSIGNGVVISLGQKEFRGELEDVLREIVSCVDKNQ